MNSQINKKKNQNKIITKKKENRFKHLKNFLFFFIVEI